MTTILEIGATETDAGLDTPTPGIESDPNQRGRVVVTDLEAAKTKPVEDPAAAASDSERPEWLPEKFKSPEDLAKSYNELVKKLGSKDPAPPADPAAPGTHVVLDSVLTAAASEFAESGEVSEGTREQLAKAGITSALLDQFVAGQQAVAARTAQEFYDAAGGSPESYQTVAEWAKDNVPTAEQDAYNRALQTDLAAAKLMLQGFVARFQTAQKGTMPERLLAGMPRFESLPAFTSTTEMKDAMASKRYKTDPGFRAEVAARVAKGIPG